MNVRVMGCSLQRQVRRSSCGEWSGNGNDGTSSSLCFVFRPRSGCDRSSSPACRDKCAQPADSSRNSVKADWDDLVKNDTIRRVYKVGWASSLPKVEGRLEAYPTFVTECRHHHGEGDQRPSLSYPRG